MCDRQCQWSHKSDDDDNYNEDSGENVRCVLYRELCRPDYTSAWFKGPKQNVMVKVCVCVCAT